MKIILNILSLLAIVFIYINSSAQEIKKYIFIGHPYNFNTYQGLIDPRCITLELPDNYDGIWLGGDVLAKSLRLKEDVAEIDSIFNISNPSNHWVIGNHDAWGFNLEWYYEICNRKTYYAYFEDQITTIVMNTNITPIDCEKLDEQFEIISNVCDTISESDALFVLLHHCVWASVGGLPAPNTYANLPKPFWNSNCSTVSTPFFSNSIYPKLIEVRDRGVEVYCIMGDMGVFEKTFYMLSDDGIHFLGCGLWNTAYSTPEDIENAGQDKVLIFEHNLNEHTISFNFHDIDSLVENYTPPSTIEY